MFYLLLFAPLVGFLINGFRFKSKDAKTAGVIASSALFLSFAAAVALFFRLQGLAATERSLEFHLFDWINVAGFSANMDFIIDPLQVEESAACGADALLLIARVLSAQRLGGLLEAAAAWGLAALVEVHDQGDVRKALDCGADIIGINNRDLDTFAVDLGATLSLRPLLPPGCTVVSASGVRTPADVARLAGCGVDAVLVGTGLVQAVDPGARAGALAAAGRGGCGG